MVFKLFMKKEALVESQHDSLRARNAILNTSSFDEFARMLHNFYHVMLLAKKEKHGPGNHPDRLNNDTKNGEPGNGVHALWSCPCSHSFNSTNNSLVQQTTIEHEFHVGHSSREVIERNCSHPVLMGLII